jgi:hypothetical protein
MQLDEMNIDGVVSDHWQASPPSAEAQVPRTAFLAHRALARTSRDEALGDHAEGAVADAILDRRRVARARTREEVVRPLEGPHRLWVPRWACAQEKEGTKLL